MFRELSRRLSSVALLGVLIAAVSGLGIADAATGGTLILGKSNTANAVTSLSDMRGPALALHAPKGKPALTVNTTSKIRNLNADQLDGLHAKAFQRRLHRLSFSNLSLLHGWTGNCFGGGTPGIALSADGVVHFHGTLCNASSSASSNLFDIPSKLRPSHEVWLTVDECDAATGRLDIQTNGTVSVETATYSDAVCFVSLAGVSYTLPY